MSRLFSIVVLFQRHHVFCQVMLPFTFIQFSMPRGWKNKNKAGTQEPF